MGMAKKRTLTYSALMGDPRWMSLDSDGRLAVVMAWLLTEEMGGRPLVPPSDDPVRKLAMVLCTTRDVVLELIYHGWIDPDRNPVFSNCRQESTLNTSQSFSVDNTQHYEGDDIIARGSSKNKQKHNKNERLFSVDKSLQFSTKVCQNGKKPETSQKQTENSQKTGPKTADFDAKNSQKTDRKTDSKSVDFSLHSNNPQENQHQHVRHESSSYSSKDIYASKTSLSEKKRENNSSKDISSSKKSNRARGDAAVLLGSIAGKIDGCDAAEPEDEAKGATRSLLEAAEVPESLTIDDRYPDHPDIAVAGSSSNLSEARGLWSDSAHRPSAASGGIEPTTVATTALWPDQYMPNKKPVGRTKDPFGFRNYTAEVTLDSVNEKITPMIQAWNNASTGVLIPEAMPGPHTVLRDERLMAMVREQGVSARALACVAAAIVQTPHLSGQTATSPFVADLGWVIRPKNRETFESLWRKGEAILADRRSLPGMAGAEARSYYDALLEMSNDDEALARFVADSKAEGADPVAQIYDMAEKVGHLAVPIAAKIAARIGRHKPVADLTEKHDAESSTGPDPENGQGVAES